MNDQFRMFDSASRPQVPTVEFERVTMVDENPDLSWLSDPSRYEGEPAAAVATYAQQDRDRLDAYHAGDWEMIAVRARATVIVPVGQGSFASYTFESPGVWGVESDSSAEYLDSIFEEEKAALLAAMRAMGEAAAA